MKRFLYFSITTNYKKSKIKMNQKDYFSKILFKKIKNIDFKKSTKAEKSFTTRRPFFYSSNAQKKMFATFKMA